MLNILHIIPSLRKGGAERLVLNICNELQNRKGLSVKLVILHQENEYEFLSKNIDIELCNSKVVLSITKKNIIDLVSLNNIIKAFKPHIIQSHLFEAELISRWITKSGIKYFTHCHNNMIQFRDFDISTLFNKNKITNFYEKQLLLKKYVSCKNTFITISKNNEAYFKKALTNKFSNNVILLNNAIDTIRFKQESNERMLTKKKKLHLLTVGSLIQIKNHIFLIDVIYYLKSISVINFKLTIIGDGPLKKVIEEKILEKNLNENIFLTGNIDNVEIYYNSADLYIYSCTLEGFGLTLLEAMSAGLPVICLDGGGNLDIVENGKNGFVILNNDVKSFANKIIKLVENNRLYTEMSQYAKNYVKKYDIKEYVDNLLEIYKR